MASAHSKGKRKAVERTPPLDEYNNETGQRPPDLQEVESAHTAANSLPPMRQAWRSYLETTVLVLFTICLGLLLGVILLAESYASPALENIDRALAEPEGVKFWRDAVPMRGPESINVVSVESTQDERGIAQLQMNMSVTMKMTVDTDFIMGFRENRLEDEGWWTKMWKDVGRWGIRRLGDVTATLDEVTVFPSSPTASNIPLLTIIPLASVTINLSPGLSDMDQAAKLSSLTSVNVPLLIRPSQNVSQLLDFVEKSWAQAFANVRIHGGGLHVNGGHIFTTSSKWWKVTQWRGLLKFQKPKIALHLKLPIPPLKMPSHPPIKPGTGLPALSDFLTLEAFTITSSSSPVTPPPVPPSEPQVSPSVASYSEPRLNNFLDQKVLAQERPPSSGKLDSVSPPDALNIILTAQASLAHPFSSFASKLDLNLLPLPFTIALPVHQSENESATTLSYTILEEVVKQNVIPVARVYASPSFNATHIRIPLSGYILPISDSSYGLADAISRFVGSYLSYKPADIAIFTPLYPSMVVRATFPPPPTRLELLRNVTIKNMSIRPGFGSIFVPGSELEIIPESEPPNLRVLEILASATVHARVVLPAGMDIDLDVERIWIDCFVFDGEVPPEGFSRDTVQEGPFNGERRPDRESGGDPPVPEPRPLPDPLPARAFARITPKHWLNASSTYLPPEDDAHVAIGGQRSNSGSSVSITAKIVDVPLEVLPGRGNDLSKFVTKVLFSSEPAIAGIRGVAAVVVRVPGLTSPTSSGPRVERSGLVLTGLPFEGNVKVGGA